VDFFERQDQARRKTNWLVVYFFAAIIFLTLALYVVVVALFFGLNIRLDSAVGGLWRPQLLLIVTAVTWFVILCGSLQKIVELRGGGGAVATGLGGRPIDLNTQDPDERRLLNVVEEMAIAAGLPAPEIYLLDAEPAINAFAAGFTPKEAVLGVTRGSLQWLSRDELQGVIAHEFSHILNGDMRLNVRLIGLLNGILALTLIGRIILNVGSSSNGSSRRRTDGRLALLGIVLLVLGAVGVFFGRLIKSAVSRQREYLADSAAVQFTRNPAGLAGALKKIGGSMQGSRLQTARAEEASHLFFGNGLKESWFSWMSTHPPLVDRIRALDPSFDGVFPRLDMPQRELKPPQIVPAKLKTMAVPAAAIAAETFVRQVGQVTPPRMDYAAQLRVDLPGVIRAAAHEPFSAVALVYNLLLNSDQESRVKQIEELKTRVEQGMAEEMGRLWPEIEKLDEQAKLAVVNICMPGLRRLALEQFDRFAANLQFLVESDEQLDLFEFSLQKIVRHNLQLHFHPAPPPLVQYYSVSGLLPEISVLLSALARIGNERSEAQGAAFATGAGQLRCSDPRLQFLPWEACDLRQIDVALAKMGQAAPQVKKIVINACAFAVAADGVICAREAELLRAIGSVLNCPLPSFLGAEEATD